MSNSSFLSNISHEILDSKLFKFEVTLPSVHEMFCLSCKVALPDRSIQCTICQSKELSRRNRAVKVDIQSHVALDYDTVERSLADIPAELSFWAAVYAEAKYRTNLLERVVKTARAVTHEEVIKAGMKEGVRLAQDSIKVLVEKDDRVNRAEGELAQSHMIASKLYYMVEAIRMKADLGRTLTSLKRTESGSQQ
jgi:hypothetical protein